VPLLGKWAVDTNNKMLLLAAGVAASASSLQKLASDVAQWTVKQSELNKGMA